MNTNDLKKLVKKYKTAAEQEKCTLENCRLIIDSMENQRRDGEGLTTFSEITDFINEGIPLFKLKNRIDARAKRARMHAASSPGALASIPPLVLQRLVLICFKCIENKMIEMALIDGIDLVKINEDFKNKNKAVCNEFNQK